MRERTLYMQTTKVAPTKTASQITTLLVETGARAIAFDYDGDRRITGMKFSLDINGTSLPFRLPLRVEALYNAIHDRRVKTMKQRAAAYEQRDREQAERVAWRQLLRWIEAQLGMVDAGMARNEEVFLPYLTEASGRTLFEAFAVNGFKLLGPSKET